MIVQVLVDKKLVTRLSAIAAEKAKKTVTKIKAALAKEVPNADLYDIMTS